MFPPSTPTARLLRYFSLAIAMLLPAMAAAEPSAIYLVRHGEKASVGQDPALTPQGRLRAQNIAAILQRTGIQAILSTPTARTLQTAQPLAQQLGLTIERYDPATPKALVDKVNALRGAVLVVGHSNTLPELVRLFGGAPGADIGDDEYDRLYQLTPDAGGAVRTVVLTSLPASGSKP
ncbi:histidine phosphatase family protein [Massilia sp. HP4]|uniref:SixA phosphatase family protein n=1 Tax=Massilia sp. HP4 TaxID=2562316 RepID=UPI001E601A5F|nr:histidine phosphatase family protein [Massilia sp. HP4]